MTNHQSKNKDREASWGGVINVGIFAVIIFLVSFVIYLNFRNSEANLEPAIVTLTPTLFSSGQPKPLPALATTPVILPSATNTNTPFVTLTPTIGFVSNVQDSFSAQVSCSEIKRSNLRKSPGFVDKDDTKDVIFEIPCEQFVELLGETKYVDDLTWWKVKWRDYEGWMSDHTGSGKVILVIAQPAIFSQSNPEEFVFWYFNAVWRERDYRYLWDNFLTSSFQNHSSSGDFNEYVKWWDSVLRIDFNSIDILQNNGATAEIKINVTFYLADKRILDNRKYEYAIVFDSNKNVWMFDYR